MGASEPPSAIAKWLQARGRNCWDGVIPNTRQDIPRNTSESRIVTYDSCRGLEGWSVICIGIDEFWNRKYNQLMNEAEHSASSLSIEERAQRSAATWMMIPITRPMDTLVMNITNQESVFGNAVNRAASLYSDFVEWIEP
jgi:hypothetical protein